MIITNYDSEIEIVLASIGYPQNSEFYIVQLVFFKDSLYLFEKTKDKRFKEEITDRLNKVRLDSLLNSIANYFSEYSENHIQKYLSKRDQRRNDFVDLRCIVVKKKGVSNVVFFAANGTKYDDKSDNLPDIQLQSILNLMLRHHAKYFAIPLD